MRDRLKVPGIHAAPVLAYVMDNNVSVEERSVGNHPRNAVSRVLTPREAQMPVPSLGFDPVLMTPAWGLLYPRGETLASVEGNIAQ